MFVDKDNADFSEIICVAPIKVAIVVMMVNYNLNNISLNNYFSTIPQPVSRKNWIVEKYFRILKYYNFIT